MSFRLAFNNGGGQAVRRGLAVCHGRLGVVLRCVRSSGRNPSGSGATGDILAQGFDAHAAGRCDEALAAYRHAQRSDSPLVRALASNAESLQVLRAPVGIAVQAEDPLKSGDRVLAPWVEDGADYFAVLSSSDEETGHCTVDWEDGAKSHQVVPLAALTSVDGKPCGLVLRKRPWEVRMWFARRSMRNALSAWQAGAEAGIAHDAFVDLTGLLCDTAFAEARAVIFASWSSEGQLLGAGLEHARIHLQRARWAAERAYSPDSRALAAISFHRAELLRLTAAAADRRGETSAAQLTESLRLHEVTAQHLALATWASAGTGDVPKWQSPGGRLQPEVIHQIVWAKTLASQACHARPVRSNKHRVTRDTAQDKRILPIYGRRRHSPKSRRVATHVSLSLPEKLLPPGRGSSESFDRALFLDCPARAAAARAWIALHLAAGVREPVMDVAQTLPWHHSPSYAENLIRKISPTASSAHLLLEVAVLVFAMGCKTAHFGKARAVALPLATTAAAWLAPASENCGTSLMPDDDVHLAASHAAALLAGQDAKSITLSKPSKTKLSRSFATNELSNETGSDQTSRPPRHLKWRFAKYDPLDELWQFRIGTRHLALMMAPPPLTFCLEGLALSETWPALEQSNNSDGRS